MDLRIRTVKPEFWRSPDVSKLEYFTRLLFVGLWNYADDNGVGEDDVALIRSDLFPRDDVAVVTELIQRGLAELSLRGLITRYVNSIDGRRYLAVTNWQHQRIDKPSKSTKPLPTSEHCYPTGATESIQGTLVEPSALYQGTEVPREQGPRERGRTRETMSITALCGNDDTPPPPPPPDLGKANELIRQVITERYPQETMAALRRTVANVLKQGYDDELILRALTKWNTKRLSPQYLPMLIADEMKPAEVSAADKKAKGWLEL